MSNQASITVIKDGPLKEINVSVLTLSDGSKGETKTEMFLCRCGQSASKPFCDGTHTKISWKE